MKASTLKTALFTIVTLAVTSCALKPVAWTPPHNVETIPENNQLADVQHIDLGEWCGPEDIVRDASGNLFCGVHKSSTDFSNGVILKIKPDGTSEIFYEANSWVAGLHFAKDSQLIALSHKQGLISIDKYGIAKVLVNKDEKGRPFLIPNGLDIASDGMIYFSNTSHKSAYDIDYGRKLILEMRPNGALYSYNPFTKKVTTLIDGTYFGNGVVLSQNEDYLLMTETTKYRVLRYWLKGSRKGEKEIFIDNLPGFPNGISRRNDGTFWLGFTTRRSETLDKIHPKPGTKKLVYALPNFMQPKQEAYGMIYHISEQGKVVGALFDPTGQFVPEAGSVKEFDSQLFMGGDVVPYISKYQLP